MLFHWPSVLLVSFELISALILTVSSRDFRTSLFLLPWTIWSTSFVYWFGCLWFFFNVGYTLSSYNCLRLFINPNIQFFFHFPFSLECFLFPTLFQWLTDRSYLYIAFESSYLREVKHRIIWGSRGQRGLG